ncbi:MAG: hypothetical protein WDA42_04875 [Candidatus Bathyarchaeia archaeon]
MSLLTFTLAVNSETNEITYGGNLTILSVINIAHQIAIEEAIKKERESVLQEKVSDTIS